MYTAERILFDRHHELLARAELRRLRSSRGCDQVPARTRVAGWLRAAADRIDGDPRLQHVV